MSTKDDLVRAGVWPTTAQEIIEAVTGAEGAGNFTSLAVSGTSALGAVTSTGLAVTGTLSASGLANFTAAGTSLSVSGADLNSVLAVLLKNTTAGQASPGLQFYNGNGYRHYFQEGVGTAGLTLTAQDGTPFNIVANTAVTGRLDLSAASSGQIKFPATQNASADANTLDDYEEGTFTPTATSITGTNTYTGRYTKIGNRVFGSVLIATSDTIGITGGTSKLTGPFSINQFSSMVTASNLSTGLGYGNGHINGVREIFPPTAAPAAGQSIVVDFEYETT